MQSVALKALDRTTDSLIVPDDKSQALTACEYQFQLDRTIYARTVVEMALIQMKYPEREIQGVTLFGTPSHDPEIRPWNRVVDCFNLEAVVNRLELTDPAHPLPAVFKPLIVQNEEVLEREAVGYLRRIRASPLDEPLRATLEDVFVSWFEQRFKDKTAEEISAMFQQELPDLRETRSGQQLIEIGRKEGRNEGLEKGLEQGRESGRLESLKASVKRIASIREALSEATIAKIDEINSIGRLDDIELRLLNGTSINDLL
jgi:predicted transposase YdaD